MKKLLLILGLYYLILGNALASTPAFVQKAETIDNPASFTSTPTVGNLIVVAFVLTSVDNSDGYTIADNQGNVYTQISRTNLSSGFIDGGGTLYINYAVAKHSSGTFTVTITKTTNPSDWDLVLDILEYSQTHPNIPNLGIFSGATGASGTTASPGAITSSYKNTLYFSASMTNALDGGTALNGFTQRQTGDAGTTAFMNMSDLVSAGTRTGSFTITSQSWIAASAAFSPYWVVNLKGNENLKGNINNL